MSVSIDYDHLLKMCPATSLDLAFSVVDLICLATRGVSDLTDRPDVDPDFGAFEASLATFDEIFITLESHMRPTIQR